MDNSSKKPKIELTPSSDSIKSKYTICEDEEDTIPIKGKCFCNHKFHFRGYIFSDIVYFSYTRPVKCREYRKPINFCFNYAGSRKAIELSNNK
jgi:hypothetical protein